MLVLVLFKVCISICFFVFMVVLYYFYLIFIFLFLHSYVWMFVVCTIHFFAFLSIFLFVLLAYRLLCSLCTMVIINNYLITSSTLWHDMHTGNIFLIERNPCFFKRSSVLHVLIYRKGVSGDFAAEKWHMRIEPTNFTADRPVVADNLWCHLYTSHL